MKQFTRTTTLADAFAKAGVPSRTFVMEAGARYPLKFHPKQGKENVKG